MNSFGRALISRQPLFKKNLERVLITLRVRWLVFIVFVGLIVFSRLIPHIPNLTAMGAVAIMSGYYFRSSFIGLLVAPVALILSDLVLGLGWNSDWYSWAPLNYLTMAFVSLISMNLHNKEIFSRESGKTFLLSSVLSSGLFFLVSNFTVWFNGNLYPRSFSGFINCYWMALPFLRNEFAGTIIYGSVLLLIIRALEVKIEAKSHN
jgi:hypothetical protein